MTPKKTPLSLIAKPTARYSSREYLLDPASKYGIPKPTFDCGGPYMSSLPPPPSLVFVFVAAATTRHQFKMAFVFFYGRFGTPIPRRKELKMVAGRCDTHGARLCMLYRRFLVATESKKMLGTKIGCRSRLFRKSLRGASTGSVGHRSCSRDGYTLSIFRRDLRFNVSSD